MRILVAAALLLTSAVAQTKAQSTAGTDQLKPLNFLEGTLEAKTRGGSAGAEGVGTYTFQQELKGRVLGRHTESSSACRGPATFECGHNDLLYVYAESEHETLKAIYFDSEGHVIHYDVSVPEPATAVFLSYGDESERPEFKLIYQLKNTIMSGKFQIRMPGQTDWKSYLEWSGAKH